MKLNEIQQQLKAPKGDYNKFGGYAYRTASSILEAVKPLLGECVLLLDDEVVEIGSRYYVRATATLKDGDASESVTAYAREAADKKGMDEAQITGAASSYARKYALCGLFAIDDSEDDPDATNDSIKHGKREQAMEKANEGANPVQEARARLNNAIESWAKATGSDAKQEKAGIAKRKDYAPTADFYDTVAKGYESATQQAENER